MNLNSCQFAGNLTRDVEITYTPKGTAVGKFGLAINRVWKDEQNAKHEEVTFIDIECFGKTTETLAKWTSKGDSIYCETRARLDMWDDKQTGQKRSKIKFILNNFQFVKTKQKEEVEQEPQQEQEQTRPGYRAAPQRQPAAQRTAHSRPATPHDPDLDTHSDPDIPW